MWGILLPSLTLFSRTGVQRGEGIRACTTDPESHVFHISWPNCFHSRPKLVLVLTSCCSKCFPFLLPSHNTNTHWPIMEYYCSWAKYQHPPYLVILSSVKLFAVHYIEHTPSTSMNYLRISHSSPPPPFITHTHTTTQPNSGRGEPVSG